MKKYIISIDSGTTSVRTLIIDQQTNVYSLAQKEFTQYFPHLGWVEHDADELYASQFSTMVQAMQQKNLKAEQIEAIGITNQRETIVIWDKNTGIPIYNAIVWQDRRTTKYCEKLQENEELKVKIHDKTGLLIDPYFSGTKIKWMLDHIEGARAKAEAGELLFGTIDTWIIWKLTNGDVHATDFTNASRTLLFNIKTKKWDDELLKIFDIPKSILPKVLNSSDDFGEITSGIYKGIKIRSAIGDQQSSMFGHRVKSGELKGTYGTGAFLILNTGEDYISSENGLITTIGLGLNGKITYALEGSIYVAGSALKWLKEEMYLIHDYKQIDYYVENYDPSSGVYVVPFFVGAGAPYWNSHARGMFTGLTRATNRADIVAGTAISIALQTYDIFKIFEKDYGDSINKMFIDGGVTKGEELMQFTADLLDRRLFKQKSQEITALGAAYLAGLYTGFWKNENELDKNIEYKTIFYPVMTDTERKNITKGWDAAVKAALTWES